MMRWSITCLFMVSACGGSMVADGGMMATCPAPGAGTMHGASVNMAETWAAAGSPHVLPFDTSISAPLTIEPCAVVTLAAGKTITVTTNGSITAIGTAEQPVTLRNAEGAANWASIRFIGGTGSFAFTTFLNGGAPLNTVPDFTGALDVRSGQSAPTATAPVLKLVNVTIANSGSNGVRLQSGGGFTDDSSGLVITGAASHAVSSAPPLAGSLPAGTYTGNAIDDVLLTDEGLRWDTTLRDRGVPYFSGGTNQFGVTAVGGTTSPVVLTVEPGVVWKFKKGTGLLQLDPGGTPSRAVLIARGTSAKPIVFTSGDSAPAAGDWLGIWMGGDDPRNVLDFVRIEWAGKRQSSSGSNSCQSLAMNTNNGGALRVYHLPPSTLVTNSTFLNSETNAIDRGWRDDRKPSFLSGNTFIGILQCKETHPRDENGACPMPAPCP